MRENKRTIKPSSTTAILQQALSDKLIGMKLYLMLQHTPDVWESPNRLMVWTMCQNFTETKKVISRLESIGNYSMIKAMVYFMYVDTSKMVFND